MYKIWLVNFGWYLSETFENLDEAIIYGKSKGFEFRVDQRIGQTYMLACSWSIFGGTKFYK